MKRIDVAIAIVCRNHRVLICRRRLTDRLGGLWEFPGGKVKADETLAQCLAREMLEELNIEVQLQAALPPIEHDYPDIRVRLHPFLCAVMSAEPQPLACEELKWVSADELARHCFPPANKELIDEVIARLRQANAGCSRREG